ncbi:MAG: hypothetical protein K0S01_2132 [Herbinix sp.]|nr:hypothetical protein [Herbinix sp.]
MSNIEETTKAPNNYVEYFDDEYTKLSAEIFNKSMCINRFLWRCQKILFSSAAILYGRFKGQWETIYQLYYNEEEMNEMSGRLQIPNQNKLEEISKIGKWSDEYIKIENEQKKERYNHSIFIPIHIQHVFESDKNSLCLLAFIKPTRDLNIDNDLKKIKYEGYEYFSNKVSNLATQWFAWKSYQNQLCNCFSSQVNNKKIEIDEIDKEREKITKRLYWPTPLKNYVYILDSGWNRLSRNVDETKNWSKVISDTLCLDNELTCKKEKLPNEFCKYAIQKDRVIYERLISLIPYLKINEWDWYPDECKKGFDRLSKLTECFYEKINFDGIERGSLLCFFSFQFWKDYINKKDWSTDVYSREELGKCFTHCINISYQLLAETSTNENYIDSLIWGISRYGHEVLGIETRFDIASHLLYLARGEAALHSLKAFYRDHFFHSIEVCFLGHLLLDVEYTQSGKCIWQYAAEYMHVDKKEDVLREWYVAALFHDVGYAMEIFNGVSNSMKFFGNSDRITIFNKKLTEALSVLSNELDGCFEFSKADKPEKDHGIIGAEHLKSLINNIKNTKPEVEDFNYACNAIANHNHRKHTVTFSENPLSFLLVLCDTLQEWNRLSFQHSTAPSIILQRLNTSNTMNGFSHGPLERACINLKKGNQGEDFVSQLATGKLCFTLIYSNHINKESGVFNLWLDSICNLQRLNLEDLPFIDIEIQFITPHYSNNGKTEYQMHRLREVYSETHINFIHDFFPEQPIKNGCTNHAITYYPEAGNMPDANSDKYVLSKKEVLIINLRELTQEMRITGSIDDFRDKLKKWRKYNEDREFKGDYDSEIPG